MTDKANFTRATATGNLQSLITNYNANLDTLEAALDDSLSLSGKLPNSMTSPLDMNSQRIINLSDAQEDSDAITKRQLDAAVLDNISLSNVNSITFDKTPTDQIAVGRFVWNDQDGTLDLGLKGGNVTLQVGQEQFVRIVNKTGADFSEANYQVVKLDGAQGQRMKAVLAQANSVTNAEGTLGLVTETIAINREGFVTTSGIVRNINTTGSLQSETWADGDALYLSQATAGKLTNIKPTSGIICKVGYVEHAHSTQGKIFVHVENFAGLQKDTFLQAGASAVSRNLQDKVRESVSVKDFGAVGDGVTDDTVAIQAAMDYVSANGGGEVFVPRGSYICSSALILKRGVNLVGEGTVHHSFYTNPAYAKTGTALLVSAAAGGDCIKFESNVKGHFGIYNMSIFDNGSAAIRSICNISGILHPRLEDVEFGCIGTARGTGLLISNEAAVAPFTGQALTLYGVFRNVTTANVLDGIQIHNDCNANVFLGGSIGGHRYSLYMTGTYAVPVANCFSGVAFESSYNAAVQDIAFVSGASNIHGWVKKANAYVCKFVKLEKAKGTMFSGCYFENGGGAGTYNDGTNGSWDIVSVVALDGPLVTDVDGTDFHACSWNNFLFDKGIRTVADTLPFGVSYSTLQPAALVRRNTSAQTIAPYVHVAVDVSGQTPIFDNAVIDYDAATKLATFKQRGTYAIKATLMFSGFAGASEYVYARIVAAGYTYYGPNVVKAAGTQDVGITVDCVVTANPGQTVSLEVFQTSGVNQTISGSSDRTYMSIVKL